MKYIKKYKIELLAFLLFSLFYFLLRLYRIGSLPIFTDEAIYMRWSQIALRDSSWRFISLTDGKQPLFIWITMIFMKFIKDPLMAGRLVSVSSGFFTMVGMFFLTLELFKNKKTAFISCVLYICYPFAQVYDRMALMDGMVGTFAVWIIYFSILLIRKARLDIAYSLGFIMGGGILTKSENFLSIYLLPLTLIFFPFKKGSRLTYFFKWIVLVIFALVISQIFYAVLRLSPLFGVISEKNYTFIYPVGEWLKHPFIFFIGNLRGMADWLFSYLKLPYAILVLGSLVLIYKYPKEKILLFLYFFLPFAALALFGRTLFPRFIYFMSLSLIPLAAWFLFWLTEFINKRIGLGIRGKNTVLMILVIIIFAAYPAIVSFQFAEDPVTAPIALSDRNQYVNDWTSGWGVRESIILFKKQAENHKIYIATEGTFGLLPEALELYLVENSNVTIKGIWPIENTIPQEVTNASKKMDTYFIFYQPCPSCKYSGAVPPEWTNLTLIYSYKKNLGIKNYFAVYKVNP